MAQVKRNARAADSQSIRALSSQGNATSLPSKAQRPPARPVEHREDTLGSVEVGVLEEVQERVLAHDVGNHQVRPDGSRRVVQRDRLLRHEDPEGADVGLVEGAGDEPMDQARLADALFADEADLDFEMFRLHRFADPEPGVKEANVRLTFVCHCPA